MSPNAEGEIKSVYSHPRYFDGHGVYLLGTKTLRKAEKAVCCRRWWGSRIETGGEPTVCSPPSSAASIRQEHVRIKE